MSARLAPFTILVTGGRSTRMGSDKASLRYAAVPQIERSVRLGLAVSDRVLVACRREQQEGWSGATWASDPRVAWAFDAPSVSTPFHALADVIEGLPDAAHFFLLGIDMPLVSPRALGELASPTASGAPIVCFRGDDGELEPFPSLWRLDGAARLALRSAVTAQQFGFRRFYAAIGALGVQPTDPVWLTNVNTPEHAAQVDDLLREHDEEG